MSSAAKVRKGTARLGYSVSSDTLTHAHTKKDRRGREGGEGEDEGNLQASWEKKILVWSMDDFGYQADR